MRLNPMLADEFDPATPGQVDEHPRPQCTPPGRSEDIEEYDPTGFQRELSAGIHLADEVAYKALIDNDKERLAQHRSQLRGPEDSGQGFLATPWLLIHPGRQLTETAIMQPALILYLGLSDPAWAHSGVTCPCGTPLDADTANEHLWQCNKHGTTKDPHNTFLNALDPIVTTLPGSSTITRPKPGCPAPGCIMDMAVTGLTSMPGMQLCVDVTISNPRSADHLPSSHANANAAAEAGHREKLSRYAHLLTQTDLLFPVSIELFGGTHTTVVKQLRKWAEEVAIVAKGRPQLKGKIFQGWRIHLSYWLMRGRVAFFEASKLRCIEPDAHDRRKAAKTGFVGRWCSKRSERTRFGTG
jgi:hypothetical protein